MTKDVSVTAVPTNLGLAVGAHRIQNIGLRTIRYAEAGEVLADVSTLPSGNKLEPGVSETLRVLDVTKNVFYVWMDEGKGFISLSEG